MNDEVIEEPKKRYVRPPRTFKDKRSQAHMEKIRERFKKTRNKGMIIDDVAALLKRTERNTRPYLKHMHETTAEIYIATYVENPALRGKKLPVYKMKVKGTEVDAAKWWAKEDLE